MLWSQIINEKTSEGFQITQKTYSYVINLTFTNCKCVRCGICELICPKAAIKLVDDDNFIEIDEEKCVKCGICAYFCMFHALKIDHLTFGNINQNHVLMNKIGGIPDLNSNISISDEKCNLCKTCEKVCPTNSIKIQDEKIEIDNESCILCSWCSSTCPEGAIKVNKLYTGSLTINEDDLTLSEIQDLISICPTRCIRYKDLDENRIRNVKVKKILGKDPEQLSWVNDFCIFCGACQKIKPEIIEKFERFTINADDPFLENKTWLEIKNKLLTR